MQQECKMVATRRDLDVWVRALPQLAMVATIFTGWIYDHLLPHAEKVKVDRGEHWRAEPCQPRYIRWSYDRKTCPAIPGFTPL